MSYLTLLFPPALQILPNAPGIHPEHQLEGSTPVDAVESKYTGPGSRLSDYSLRSGVVSLDHWLDLNA